jgi:hypothetical protein
MKQHGYNLKFLAAENIYFLRSVFNQNEYSIKLIEFEAQS